MTQTEEIKPKNRTRASKIGRLLLKIFGAILILIVLFLATTYTVNIFKNKSDLKKMESYGQSATVDGKKLNVLIRGQGEETIVLLPGYGTAAPALDFKPLVDELAPYYRVAVVEPLGYGLSDDTKKERTSENIVSEIHEALQQLNIDRYILMGHSIAGIYGLEYVSKFENEVTAFVGIDSSVPTQGGMDTEFPINLFKFLRQSGLGRLALNLSADPYAEIAAYDAETKEQLGLISRKNMYNSSMMNEMEHFNDNFIAARRLKFPENLPLLLFVQANNAGVEGWIPLHEAQANDSVLGKMIPLEGDHYLHHTRSKEIVQGFREYMKEVK
ncbi:alpha/beta hydrolase [Paenibacillus lutimineralis]|uniref:Alpha/beta hydrolase n=1 Tax=Paenibacillus lutimineralis TaxID=2707005 RepID=A0A3S9UYW5_9BACL|nr:alpha/beta hydrolase [Paenibacillus lutimineralis]AZS15516.1 alpha/beta hydrolase [Paenibacillus lutimineralis]